MNDTWINHLNINVYRFYDARQYNSRYEWKNYYLIEKIKKTSEKIELYQQVSKKDSLISFKLLYCVIIS